MRVVDADELLNAVERHLTGELTASEREKLLTDIPTIEPKQGKWKRYYNHCICSECDKWVISYINHKPYNFCPNCGAQMKGADDE